MQHLWWQIDFGRSKQMVEWYKETKEEKGCFFIKGFLERALCLPPKIMTSNTI